VRVVQTGTERVGPAVDLRLYVITDRALAGCSHEEQVARAIAGGATAVQLRDKSLPPDALVAIGRRLRRLTREAGVLFLVNDLPEVASACDADGVHLGQADGDLAGARAHLGPGRVIGRSVDTVTEAVQAEREGATYVSLGPIFPTRTKPDAGPVVGLEGLRRVVQAVRIPVVAIGGIDAGNAAEVIAAGAAGVAVIRAVVAQADITAAARALRAEVDAALARRGGPAP